MIFRIDHFLSSELVRRVVTLRFLNRVFEPIWNAVHIERVDISWLESLTLEGRASYYDTAGAIKDMVQNHLMEAMALVLMEQPARIDADSFRGVRVEGLRAVATPAAETMRSATVRARYTAGTIGTREVPSYVDEPGVDPGRNTETYASLAVEVDSPRWAGVPFTLCSGKALAADSAEIAIHFRPLPRYLLSRWPGVEPNVLPVGLTEPYVRLSTTLNGPERTAETRQLEARSTPPRFTAYAHLILEMLNSDPMLFIRGDEAEEAWRIIDPVMNAWSAETSPCRNTQPARHHRACRPDTNGHVPAPGSLQECAFRRPSRLSEALKGTPRPGDPQAVRTGEATSEILSTTVTPPPESLQAAGLLAAAGLTAGSGLPAGRSQSSRRSTARSMASERDVTPSFW